ARAQREGHSVAGRARRRHGGTQARYSVVGLVRRPPTFPSRRGDPWSPCGSPRSTPTAQQSCCPGAAMLTWVRRAASTRLETSVRGYDVFNANTMLAIATVVKSRGATGYRLFSSG